MGNPLFFYFRANPGLLTFSQGVLLHYGFYLAHVHTGEEDFPLLANCRKAVASPLMHSIA